MVLFGCLTVVVMVEVLGEYRALCAAYAQQLSSGCGDRCCRNVAACATARRAPPAAPVPLLALQLAANGA